MVKWHHQGSEPIFLESSAFRKTVCTHNPDLGVADPQQS